MAEASMTKVERETETAASCRFALRYRIAA
jgi:hypothetical protein